jgi:hypothetical protein
MSIKSLALAGDIRTYVITEVLQAMQAGKTFPFRFEIYIPRQAFYCAWGEEQPLPTYKIVSILGRDTEVMVLPDPLEEE